MPVGIRMFGAYVPKLRLTKESIGWGGPGERAVAGFDEDSVTLAVAAATDCLGSVAREIVDGVLFASTTAPYWEKQSAATIASALDLRRDILSQDITSSLRAGISSLRSAADAVRGGSAKNVLVTAADCRMAYPKSDMERSLGDGAAAFLVSDTDVAVEIEASHAVTAHMVDLWRSASDTYIRSGEDRFIMDAGYLPLLAEAVAGLLKKLGRTQADFTKVVYYSPDARRHAEMAKRLGLKPQQVQEPLYGALGNTGTAFPLMLLVAALEDARPGDRILLAGYGDGAEAYSLLVTDRIEQAKQGVRGIKKHIASSLRLASYEDFLRWRGVVPQEPARRPVPQPISLQAAWRDSERNISFRGSRCRSCKHVFYPSQKVCPFCRSIDQFDPVRLSDKRGKILTFSMDYVAGTPDVPLLVAVIDFDGGGRILCMMTDRDIHAVQVGMPVEMTFRKLGVIDGIHNYFWKAAPVRVS